jgi:arylsulfatase A-like enzyme
LSHQDATLQTIPPRASQAATLAALVAMLSAYLCFNLLFRWLKYPLFSGFDAYGWPSPTKWETAYQVLMTCLPALVWAALVYAAASRFPRIAKPWALAAACFVLLTCIELDMRWYNVSRNHGTLADLALLFSNPDAIGLKRSDVERLLLILTAHALVCSAALVLSRPIAKRLLHYSLFSAPRRGQLAVALASLLALFLIDGAVVGKMRTRDLGDIYHSQWEELARANPLRIGWADRLWHGVSPRQADLADATTAMLQAPIDQAQPAAFSPTTTAPRQPAPKYNVVVIVVESFNKRLMEKADTPNYDQLRANSIDLKNHVTTGNCTHYGVLGLLYGEPVTFFGNPARKGSRLIRQFHQNGYATCKLTSCREITNLERPYEDPLTEPPFQCDGDWPLVPALKAELAKPTPRLTFVYYWRTHFPYAHKSEYNRHQPEVTENFEYTCSDVREHRREIENRYLNCLEELDAWLGDIVQQIDLANTIVVFTGDHGEEFFECGRLSHCSSLDEPQIAVPMLLHVPGRKPQTIESITSHADILPTIADCLGWDPAPVKGKSIFNPSPRAAWVAMDNHEHPANVWAVITDAGRLLLRTDGPKPKVTSLEDAHGNPLSYQPNRTRWTDTFAEARHLQLDLQQSSSSQQAAKK